jgi:hypothetical protein
MNKFKPFEQILPFFSKAEISTPRAPMNAQEEIEMALASQKVIKRSPLKELSLVKVEPQIDNNKYETKLEKSIMKVFNGGTDGLERLAFERDPSRCNDYAGVYRPKISLIPDSLLKRMAIQDDLVAAIVRVRSNHIEQFGRKQPSRHEKGFRFKVDEDRVKDLTDEQKKLISKRVRRAEKLLLSCGHTEGWGNTDRCSFSEFLGATTRNAVVVGRAATEVIYVQDPDDPSKRKFHSFRPVDAGTIYHASMNNKAALDAVRKQSLRLIASMNNEQLKVEKFENDEYRWVQVFDGRPMKAFGSEELLVYNFYPVTDIELQGYPVTPMDTALSAITTHINITTTNRMWFQSGRATRGMLVIQSPDVDAGVVDAIKQEFHASINGAQNAYRMPVFGLGEGDKLTWQPIDSGGSHDAEYMQLTDANARTILCAFQMSPEELPGYQHLSRGTNSQTLSETNNEYKLTAARDVGIRPLLAKIEDYINSDLLPLIDPELSKVCKVQLIGLDVDTEEKESIRLQQDGPLHLTFDEILQKVEKDPIGNEFCGTLPLNPTVMQYIEKYKTFGQILERFMGVKDASKDPSLQFYQNPFYFNWLQLQAQQQAQAQQQQAQQQAQAQQQDPSQAQAQQQDPSQAQAQQQDPSQGQAAQESTDLSTGLDQALQVVGQMQKSEAQMPTAKKKLKAKIKDVNKKILESWAKEQERALLKIGDLVESHVNLVKPKAPKAKK